MWLAGGRRASISTIARVGLLIFSWFHHVPLSFSGHIGPVIGPRPPGTFGPMFSIGFAPLLGTGLVLWLLYRAGTAVRRGGADGANPLLDAVAIALPYALLSLATSFLSRTTAALPPAFRLGTAATLRARPVPALLWPFGLALLAATAGAAWGGRTNGEKDGTRGPVAVAVTGGWWMFVVALTASFAGLLVLAAAKPGATATYLRAATAGGPASGAARIGLTLLVVPNMATWVLAPALGGCVGVFGGGHSACALGYTTFPRSGGLAFGGISTATAPPAYFLFLLVPLVAVVVGGIHAARARDARRAADGAVAGASAGVFFAIAVAAASILSSIVYSVGGTGARIVVGPNPLTGAGAALAWGVVGGAVTGAIAARKRKTRPLDGTGSPGASEVATSYGV